MEKKFKFDLIYKDIVKVSFNDLFMILKQIEKVLYKYMCMY